MAGFGVGLAGLGAMEGGYEEGAQNYWKRRELESTSSYGAGLRELLLDQASSQPMIMPGGPPGGAAPPMAPMAPMAPMTSGPPMAGAFTGGPPGGASPPMAGGPPPGFVNPSRVAGQPQNLTGPIIPPGGVGGGPSPGMGGPPPMPPAAPPGGAPQPLPGARPGGPMLPGGMRPQATWMDIGKAILRANPNISDDQLAFAINKAAPLMQVQSQSEWRNVEMLLQMERNDIARATLGQKGEIAGGKLEESKRKTDIAAELRREEAAGRMARANLSANTKLEIAGLSAETKKWLLETSEAGKEERFSQSDATRRELATLSRQSREEIAKALEEGRSLRADKAQDRIDARQDKGIAAREKQVGVLEAGRDRRAGAAEEGRNVRAADRLAAKDAPLIRNVQEAVREIDESILDIQESQKGGTAVTGIQGRFNRFKEWGEGLVSDTKDAPTRASVFETRMRALQAQIPRLLAGVGRISSEERAHIDNIVRGLGTFTDPQAAVNSLNELRTILENKAPRDMGVGPSRQTGGPAPRAGRQSQQPPQAPPLDLLEEGHETDIEYPDGSVHTWILRNGQPVESKGLPDVPGNLRVPLSRGQDPGNPRGAPPPF